MKKQSVIFAFCALLVSFATATFAQKVKVLVFGDSQKIVNEAPTNYLMAMDNVLTDAQTNDANFILQMGDIVEDCLVSNWEVARTGWTKFDGKIPYVLNIGNNDIANDNGGDKYKIYFPLSKFQALPSFVSNYDQSINMAHRFNVAGVNWLVISMRIAPSTATIAWAENLISINPTNRVLIISHDANPTSSVTTMALKYPNVVMVMCGHTETVEPVVLTGTQGNKLIYLKTCFHNKVLDMYACILDLDVDAGTISGRYYSPQYGKFWDDTTAPYYGDSKMPTKLTWSYSGFNFKNNEDLCPNDPTKVEPGICGCGVPEGTCDDANYPADSIVLQAENAVFSGPTIQTNQPNYNGTGFLDFTNASNDFVTWNANVKTTGNYLLAFRYAVTNNRPMKLTINGEVRSASFTFPPTGSFTLWKKVRTMQTLTAGDNSVALTTIGSNGGNFDELGISGVQTLSGVVLPKENLPTKNVKVYLQNSGTLAMHLNGFENSGNVQIKILNSMGQMVFQKSANNPTHVEINAAKVLKNAMYIVLVDDTLSKTLKKIII